MEAILTRLNAWPVRERAAILEAAAYWLLVALWFTLVPSESAAGLLIGSLAVLAPAVAALLQVLFSLTSLPLERRTAWLLIAAALAGWVLRFAVWAFYGLFLRSEPPPLSVADLFGLVAYPFAAFGLFNLSRGFRHAPSSFRFLLDMAINSGVVIALGLLFLRRAGPLDAAGFVPIAYPLADLILLMILITLVLPRLIPVRSALLPALALVGLGLSDYAYSFLSLSGSFHAGAVTGLGWIAAFLLIGIEVIRERGTSRLDSRSVGPVLELRSPALNILPIALVLALAWYVLTDWRLTGRISFFGGLTSLIFSVILVVRLGIRAGEVELQKYWQLFSSLGEPAFISDVKGRILLGNPALYNLQPQDLETREQEENLFQVFGNSKGLERSLAAAARGVITLEAESTRLHAPYLLTLSPVPGEGRRSLIAGVAHDLTDERRQQDVIRHAYNELQSVHGQLEELNSELEGRVEERTRTLSEAYLQLEEQHRALQELDRLKTDFVSMVSHELRNPLNNLGGALEVLLGRRREAPMERETLELMQGSVQRLTRFVENILDLSSLEAGRLDLRLIPVSPSLLVEEVLRKRTQDPSYSRISVQMPAELPLVLADENVVQSVLHHLLDNAQKYAPSGGIVIQGQVQDGSVRMQVMDEGPGIPPEKQRLLFQKFQRLDTADSQSVYGYGLGLYLSRRLLQAMRSGLEYEALPGGSCFYFDLEVAK